jgi:protein SCO1
MKTGRWIMWAVLSAIFAVAMPVRAQMFDEKLPKEAEGVGIQEKVGETLPMDLIFTNSEGQSVSVGHYFGQGPGSVPGKPTILALVFYDCPLVCSVVLEKMNKCFDGLDYTIGKDFNVLVYSFDHTETVEKAKKARLGYTGAYNRDVTPEVLAGWQWHVGDVLSNKRLADSVGFKYKALADERNRYSHPVGIFVVTPQGKLSRVFSGFSYPSRDVKLALMEASEGKLRKSLADRVIAFCYMYDPKAGSYSLQAMRVMQVAGAICAVTLGGLVGGLLLVERTRKRRRVVRAALEASLSDADRNKGSATNRTKSPLQSPERVVVSASPANERGASSVGESANQSAGRSANQSENQS